jgi:hypothetical protein
MLHFMKLTDHLIGDRVSVRCRNSYRPGDTGACWLGGRVIGREAKPGATRYVVQLDDDRRVVADGGDVRRFTLAFELYQTLQTLEKMAS